MKIKEWRFRPGEAFPHDSVLARWLLGLSVVANDIILSGNRLETAFCNVPKGEPTSEGIYFFRLVASHFREAAKFIDDAHGQPEVQQFIKSLSPKLRKQYESVLKTFRPFKGSFVEQVLKPLRNDFFHYPSVNSSELADAVKQLCDMETSFELKGDRIADFRAVFADEVMACLSGEIFGQNRQRLSEAVSTTMNAVYDLVNFYIGALKTYFSRLPAKVVTRIERDDGAHNVTHS